MTRLTDWDDSPSIRFPIFTRANAGEVFVEASSPLTWTSFGFAVWESAWRDAYYRIGAFTPGEFKENACEVVGCFGGYGYINASASRVFGVRAPGLSADAIDQAFFGTHPVSPYRPDPRDDNAERTAAIGAWLGSVLDESRLPEIWNNSQMVNTFVSRRPHLKRLANEQLVQRFRETVPIARNACTIHLETTYACSALVGIIDECTAVVGMADSGPLVLTSLTKVISAEQSYDIWRLSRLARYGNIEFPPNQDLDQFLGQLKSRADTASREFLKAWDLFISKWAYVGPSSFEFRSPTYGSYPTLALKMLERATMAPDNLEPTVRSEELKQERDKAVAQISAALKGQELHSLFTRAASAVARYLPAREQTKADYSRVSDEARMVLRELSERMVEQGAISRWQDILLLIDGELESFIADPSSYVSTLEARRTQFETALRRDPIFVFEGEPYSSHANFPPTLGAGEDRPRSFTGLGVAPGSYTGPARVMNSLDDAAKLSPGDIIVAPSADSCWGPLLLTAGAIVVENGAAVSHVAIVARELGLPAVMSVDQASTSIPDGSTIIVNGSTGIVTRLD